MIYLNPDALINGILRLHPP